MKTLIVLVVTLLAGCATNVRPISEQERCERFGGMYLAGSCHPFGGGGSM